MVPARVHLRTTGFAMTDPPAVAIAARTAATSSAETPGSDARGPFFWQTARYLRCASAR